jgi:hypothetical protein
MLARASSLAQTAAAALSRDHCQPCCWAEDVAAIIERISMAVPDPECFVPEEVRDCGGLRTAKEIAGQFGELACWWPAMVERAKVLAESGVWIGSVQ